MARRGWLRPVAISLAVGVLCHNGLALGRALTSAEAKTFFGEELIEPFRAGGIRRAYGTYRYCYNIAFFTDEQVIIEPVFNNYSPHDASKVARAKRIAYVDDLTPQLQNFPERVDVAGVPYHKTDSWFGEKSGFVVLERDG